jgi:alanyl-tRNA synthetase
MRKCPTKVVGNTTDGQLVIGDVFYLYNTYGIPLEIILEEMKKRNLVCDWDDFTNKAIGLGINKRKLKFLIQNSVEEVFGQTYCNEFMKIWRNLYEC